MIVEGDPADELLHMAEAGHYDMIVLGAHGRSSFGGFLLGAVHAKVLHHARLPVLLVRNVRPIQRLLVAYRGSQCDQGALEFIAPLFAKKKPEITIMHVQETSLAESEEFAQACVLTGEQTLRDFGYQPVKKLAKGDFVEEILKDVAIERYDLLVLGAYGHKKPRYLKSHQRRSPESGAPDHQARVGLPGARGGVIGPGRNHLPERSKIILNSCLNN